MHSVNPATAKPVHFYILYEFIQIGQVSNSIIITPHEVLSFDKQYKSKKKIIYLKVPNLQQCLLSVTIPELKVSV
jgi:hypothetical protein